MGFAGWRVRARTMNETTTSVHKALDSLLNFETVDFSATRRMRRHATTVPWDAMNALRCACRCR